MDKQGCSIPPVFIGARDLHILSTFENRPFVFLCTREVNVNEEQCLVTYWEIRKATL